MSNSSLINQTAFEYAVELNKGATYSDSETAFREFLEWYLSHIDQVQAEPVRASGQEADIYQSEITRLRTAMCSATELMGKAMAIHTEDAFAVMGEESILKDEQRGNPDCLADDLSPSPVSDRPSEISEHTDGHAIYQCAKKYDHKVYGVYRRDAITKPVSLEECTKAIEDMNAKWRPGNISTNRDAAKTVLDAAGVKYVD